MLGCHDVWYITLSVVLVYHTYLLPVRDVILTTVADVNRHGLANDAATGASARCSCFNFTGDRKLQLSLQCPKRENCSQRENCSLDVDIVQ